MKRIEIFSNNELLSEFLEEIEKKLPEQYFSILEVRHGKGRNGEARGDSVWPEVNFYCIMFTDSEKTIQVLQSILIVMKHDNPVNAMKMFVSDAHTVSLKEYRPSHPVEHTATLETEKKSFSSTDPEATEMSNMVTYNITDTV